MFAYHVRESQVSRPALICWLMIFGILVIALLVGLLAPEKNGREFQRRLVHVNASACHEVDEQTLAPLPMPTVLREVHAPLVEDLNSTRAKPSHKKGTRRKH